MVNDPETETTMTRIVPTALEFINHAYDIMEGKLAIPPNRWTDIERAIIPLIVLQDHPDAESVEMRDDGAMLLKLADANQTRMNEIDLSGLTICTYFTPQQSQHCCHDCRRNV